MRKTFGENVYARQKTDIIVAMKRIIALIGIVCLLVGISGVKNAPLVCKGGTLTRYPANPSCVSEPLRIDFYGDGSDAEEYLKKVSARVLLREQVDGLDIIYAYTPHVGRSEWVHGRRINLMLAVGGGKISVGVPLLKGCY